VEKKKTTTTTYGGLLRKIWSLDKFCREKELKGKSCQGSERKAKGSPRRGKWGEKRMGGGHFVRKVQTDVLT